MSPTTAAPPEILIPSLPNDVAVQCLARVPRQYHPVLAAVSKPIRSLLSSPEFFAVRSSLNSTELLLYLRIQRSCDDPDGWFAVYGRPNQNHNIKSRIIMAPVPGIPDELLYLSNCGSVGPKIYVLGGLTGCGFSTEVWTLDCRFQTWERGPSLPTARMGAAKTVVFDGKIYVIGWSAAVEESWIDVFDTVDGHWEALPSPKVGVRGKEVVGCAIRGGKVCVWSEFEELKFDPATKTWEVLRSGVGSGLCWATHVGEVNGVLYCAEYHKGMIKGFDERIGVWKEVEIVNKSGLLPNYSWIPWMVNAGGRLVILGWRELQDELDDEMEIWSEGIEVKTDGDGNFQGEILWSEMVASMSIRLMDKVLCSCACFPVSL